MSPELSRRNFLAGVAGLGATYWSARRLQRGAKDADFGSWSPAEGTWPLPYYDTANTSYSPDATPPTAEPAVERVADGDGWVPLVGTEHVAFDGGEHTLYARDYEPVGFRAEGFPRTFGPPDDERLYTVSSAGEERITVRAVSTADEPTVEHETTVDVPQLRSLVPGREALYLGGPKEVVELGPELSRGWRVGGTQPALDGDRLYVHGAGLAAYDERSGVDRRLGVGPKREWRADVPGRRYPPAVANGRVVTATAQWVTESSELSAFDAATGERLWGPHSPSHRHATPAVVGGRGFLAAEDEEWNSGLVACLDLDTGEALWRDETDWNPRAAAVGGDTLVVVGHRDRQESWKESVGMLRVYALDGEVLWTTELDVVPGAPALADGKILFGAGGGLYEAA